MLLEGDELPAFVLMQQDGNQCLFFYLFLHSTRDTSRERDERTGEGDVALQVKGVSVGPPCSGSLTSWLKTLFKRVYRPQSITVCRSMLLISRPHTIVTTKRSTWLYKSVGLGWPAMLGVAHQLTRDFIDAVFLFTEHWGRLFDALKSALARRVVLPKRLTWLYKSRKEGS